MFFGTNLTILIILGVFFVWVAVLSFFLYRINAHYRRLTRDSGKKNLVKILEKLLKESKNNQTEIKKLTVELEKIENEINFHLQKVGLIRYNPFAETGGDQSFCLALLDNEENGVVITSLHSRDNTRIYAKPVKKGKQTDYVLSEEEIEAIKQAKKID